MLALATAVPYLSQLTAVRCHYHVAYFYFRDHRFWNKLIDWLIDWYGEGLVFNGTFSTNRLYHTTSAQEINSRSYKDIVRQTWLSVRVSSSYRWLKNKQATVFFSETTCNKLCGRPPQYTPAPCKLTFDLFDLESGVRVTCDVGYLYANFSLSRPLCSRLRPGPMYATDRQTSDAHHRLMPHTLWGRYWMNGNSSRRRPW